MAFDEKRYLDLTGLTTYDDDIKAWSNSVKQAGYKTVKRSASGNNLLFFKKPNAIVGTDVADESIDLSDAEAAIKLAALAVLVGAVWDGTNQRWVPSPSFDSSISATTIVSALNEVISDFNTKIGTIPSTSSATNIIDYINEQVTAGNVTGVKGDAEDEYRNGLVNLTPANIGAVSTTTFNNQIGNHIVNKDVPSDAKFTDTIYDDTLIANRITTVENLLDGHSVAKDVPEDAKFTDTTYESKSAVSEGTDVSLVTTGEKYTWNNKANKATTLAGYGITDAATSAQGAKADTAVQSVKIGSNSTEYKSGTTVTLPAYPSKTSDLTNDSNFVNDAYYVHTDNNYTITDKEKLAGIATGAEVNQNAFSNVKIGNTTISADSKTDTLELVAGNNVTLTPDATSDTVTINAVDTTYESKSAASGGTAVSLVTTGEKYIWNNKSNFSGNYNDLTNKPTLGTAAAKDVPSSGNASTTQVVMGNDTRLTDSRNAKDVYSWAKASTKPSYTASEVGAIATTAKGANGGVAELDSTGKVPSSQLPSFVDDVLEYDNQSSFPTTGESGKIYIAKDTNKTYRWSGTAYVEISSSLALGETSSTAYRGDRGKIAYDHSQSAHARTDATAVAASSTNGNIKINGTETTVYTHPGSGTNPHGTTKSDVGLGNVGNFKAVSTVASQGLSDTEKSNARANIGAGTSNFSGSYNDLTNKPTIPTVNNATLTIQKNGTNVQTFTANQSTNATANITVPTKVSELTNDSGYKTGTYAGSSSDGGDATRALAVKDSYSGQNTTFAYGKAGLGYNEYTWLAGWNGYELRAVNKSQFLTTHQDISGKYDKITQLGIKQCNANGQYNYFKIATLKITQGYVNGPIAFELSQREYEVTTIQVSFLSNSGSDPGLGYFITNQRNNYWIVKETTSTWSVYGTYNEAWGACALHRIVGFRVNNGVTVTVNMENVSEIPSGATQVIYGGNCAFATSAGNASKVNNLTVQTAVPANAKFTDTTYSAGSNITLTGTVFSLTKANVTGALGYTPPTADTNTHRPIQVNGTEVLGNNTTALNLKAGSNVSLSNSNGTVTIAATDTTYSSKSAASGGTDVSLVTTGEKYTWNNKSNLTIGTTSTTAAAGNHTHEISIATDSGTNQLTMAANTKYKITAGGSSYIFTTPPDKNSGGTITKIATTAGAHTAITVTSGAASFNVPTKTSHLTNDSGFLTAHQTIKQDGVTGATVNRFGTCSTAAGTAAKEVSITTGTFSLEAGATIAVKFSNANTAGTPTLNVNSKGAKNIFVNGAQITTGGNKSLLTGTVIFVYDGTQWHLIGNYYDTNTQTVTGIKGNAESSYRTGNVNLTCANIGAATSNHTHSISIATDSGTNQLTMAANTKYKITAGGSSYIFTTPPDGNTDTKVTQTADDSTNSNFEVIFSATADNTTRTEASRKSSKLKFNPSTGNLTVTKVNGVSKKYTSGVSCAVGATTCTISDSAITTSSIITPFSSNSSGNVISITNIAVSSGKVILSFEALTEATSFRVEIVN